MLILGKTSQIKAGRVIETLFSAFMAVKEDLVLIYTEIFWSTNCCTYRHDVMPDWQPENNKKLLPFFPVEWPSSILPGQLCHLAHLPG